MRDQYRGAPRRDQYGHSRGRPPARRPRRRGWRHASLPVKFAYVAGTVFTVLAMALTLGVYGEYLHLSSNIKSVVVGGLTHRSVYGVQNFLLLGSTSRLGQGKGFGHNGSKYTANSDNLLIVHLDPTHTHALILSIPRDTMVYEPGCKARKHIGYGIWGPYQSAIIDGAMNIGGPTCAVATVKDLTGIKIDHFVEFDFNSFREMVNAIGGVEVCAPPGGYHDPYTGLNISGGKHLLSYNQALAYVRTRHGVSAAGDVGGDLPRIELQQAFISSIIQKVNSQGILSNSFQLLKIADTATKALTVDSGMDSVSKLLGLAKTLIHLRASHVTLITMPTTLDPANTNRLIPLEPQDDILFQMLQDSLPWHHTLPTVPFGKVQVRVMNGTGTPGLAHRTAVRLRALGFDVVGTGNAPAATTTTVTYSGTVQADSAYTLMTALQATPTAQDLLAAPAPQTGTPGPVTLVIGPGFTGVKTLADLAPHHHRRHHHSSGGSPASIQSRNAGASICSGLPKANPNPGKP